jgi:hypothetical protein
MSQLHVLHIKATLEKLFSGKINMSDYDKRSPGDKTNAFLSRSLSAYALMQEAKIDVDKAAASLVDGPDDSGIDAIYWDQMKHLIYLVQSKWVTSGNGSPEQGDVQKFIKGFHNLLDLRFDKFNENINKRKTELENAMSDPGKVILILAYTGEEPLSKHASGDLADLLTELNSPTPLAELKIYSQKELHNSAVGLVEGEPVNLSQVLLHNWNLISDPLLAYYGQIDAEAIANWWKVYGTRLFESNLRKFIGSTDVNDAITETLRENPEIFWYFNNGITIICKNIEKTLAGGADKSAGVFNCSDISIINGAQTVGCIGDAFGSNPEQVKLARVMVRLIDLGDSSSDFAKEIARATNTQNRIGPRDFISLDPEQQRLKMDLLIEGKEYVYKAGDVPLDPRNGLDITEATVALACANQDLRLAVDAKREISSMWENIDAAPYKQLFNSRLTSTRLWRIVEIHRIVNAKLRDEQSRREGRERMIAVFGNLFILHQVFKSLPLDKFDDTVMDFDPIKEKASMETIYVCNNLIQAVNGRFPESFLQPLFKNKTKCSELDSDLASMRS